MIDRCYNPKCKEYKYYGLLGITVDERWHNFDDFLKDIELIDGWDLDRYKKGELVLDNDIKEVGNKVYSLEKCKWATREENLGFVPSRSKKILGIDPNGREYIFFNQSKFAKEHNLIQSHISAVLRGERNHHKNWSFKVLQEYRYEPVEQPAKLYTPHYVAYKDGIEIDYDRVKTSLLKRLNIPTSDTNFRKMETGEDCYGITFKVEKRERFDYT